VVSLNQVMMNLITNAVDAMPDGGVIDIKVYKDDEKIKIQVCDSGMGIPQDIQGKIFDPFFTTKEVGAGQGLGLYIVYNEIVHKHKGKVEFTTGECKGSSFVISLPNNKIV